MPVIVYRRQKQILEFIGQYIQRHGYAPTLHDIANAIGVSSLATVHEHLLAMVKKGLIRKFEGEVRGLEITDPRYAYSASAIELSLLGFIAAGAPIDPINDPTSTVSVPTSLLSGKRRAFALKVRGNSMIEDGILDGDIVIIEQQNTADNGDIVVAILENGFATLKRFFREATRVRLEPANSSMSPIFAQNVRIQGKVVGVIRKY